MLISVVEKLIVGRRTAYAAVQNVFNFKPCCSITPEYLKINRAVTILKFQMTVTEIIDKLIVLFFMSLIVQVKAQCNNAHAPY